MPPDVGSLEWCLQEIFASLDRGAVLVTATRRLARVFREDYASWQRDRGRSLWNTPRILPFEAYVRQLWADWVTESGDELVLLTPEQERLVWAQIIRDSPHGDGLLQIDATARRAAQAWGLIQAYRLPLDERFQVTEDCSAFLGWAREFERRCTGRGWLDSGRLVDTVMARVRPASVWFVGFDELSPVQREFFDKAGARRIEAPLLRSVTHTKVCATAEDEIRCAADWSRAILLDDPAARVGIVVLNLSQLRSKVEHVFSDVLQSDEAFHISLGRRLDQYPLIHAALLILDLAVGRIPLTRAGMLLRSHYLGGWPDDRMARASLDVRLRRFGGWDISVDELARSAFAECRVLSDGLRRLATAAQAPVFARAFSEILAAMGWPGDQPLGSREHQLVRRWTELLSQFAALEIVSPVSDLAQGVARLHRLAAGAIFQFEDTGAPVQISDETEIAGVRFDHLWVMGLHDEALPAAADPNPFIPIGLQGPARLPGASAARQQESARVVFDRLTSSARQVVLSFPRVEGDRVLSPSPLLTATPQPAVARPSAWISAIRASASLETIVDETAPPLVAEGVQRGGAHLLRDMAACPFRAFATYRLNARELDNIEPGLSARDKGTVLHEVLQLVWHELGSRAALCALGAGDLLALIRRNIAAVLDRFGDTTNVAVERVRLERLLTRWMELERGRSPFTVVTVEEKKTVEVSGLCLDVRADRIDELEDGRRAILDYKSGNLKAQCWTGDRLDEPQVPLYCISSEAPIGAAVFARVQPEKLGLAGLADEYVHADFQSYASKGDPPLRERIEEWRQALTSLAEQFRAGDARVEPKYGEKTCEYCAIVPLCRIREYDHG